MPQFVLLWTDAALWLLVLAALGYARHVWQRPPLRANWAKVFQNTPAMCSSVVLLACLALTLLDSVHFRERLAAVPGQTATAYDPEVKSLLDVLLKPLVDGREKTYSMPLATHSFTKESVDVDGQPQRLAPRLVYGGAHLKNPPAEWAADVLTRGLLGAAAGALVVCTLMGVVLALAARRAQQPSRALLSAVWQGQTRLPWKAAGITLLVLGLLTGAVAALLLRYHVLGTDVTGNDVLYQTLKSLRTAFVIGALSTLFTLPLAVVLGIAAGYWRGWVDELIQYLYTVLSSVPNILLIAALVLMVQVFIDKNPDMLPTAAQRADLKLFLLCAVLGLTGWAGLCRLLRAETLKVRELEYVQAAQAFGVSDRRIMLAHVFPNVAHLMLIVTVLEFSALILYEAVLAIVGVGVDPSMNSFGGMINYARNEMSRDPVVWWPFASAFVFMVALVLAANLFADGVRDAFDPRAAHLRPRWRARKPAL
ncbi:MAG: ABC transporter permease [Rubrivivax sp.]|jgi:peptide/nickel transport system permease protein|nr:ABC transporter permease [Rubrivivax sp.]